MTNAHTLATEEALARFVQILDAQYAWAGMTKIQRTALTARLHGNVTPQTIAALERRGLVSEGLVTAWGEWVRAVNVPAVPEEGS